MTNLFLSLMQSYHNRLSSLEQASEAVKLRADLAAATDRIVVLEQSLAEARQQLARQQPIIDTFETTTDRLERALAVLDPDVQKVIQAVKTLV